MNEIHSRLRGSLRLLARWPRPSRPDRVWNRIPEAILSKIVDLALINPNSARRALPLSLSRALSREPVFTYYYSPAKEGRSV